MRTSLEQLEIAVYDDVEGIVGRELGEFIKRIDEAVGEGEE